MRFAAILLNWNKGDLTCACLDSLLEAGFELQNIIVVDNASTDGSPAIIASRFPELRILRNKANLGFGAGNNVGIRDALASGAKFIWLLNNDTIVAKGTFTAMLEQMEADPKIGIVGSVISRMDSTRALQAFGGYKLNVERCYVLPCAIGERPDFITGASMLLRREALLDSGLFDEKFFMYWEDADLCLRIKAHGWGIAVAEGSALLHAEGGSGTSFKAWRHSTRSALRFSWKHSPCLIKTLAIGFFLDRGVKPPLKALLKWMLRLSAQAPR